MGVIMRVRIYAPAKPRVHTAGLRDFSLGRWAPSGLQALKRVVVCCSMRWGDVVGRRVEERKAVPYLAKGVCVVESRLKGNVSLENKVVLVGVVESFL